MTDLEPLGQNADRGRPVGLEPLELQQEQILLRFHSGCATGDLADTEESSDLVPQFGESRIVNDDRWFALPACANHVVKYIVRRYTGLRGRP